jgi:class 3 adenylate cyclase
MVLSSGSLRAYVPELLVSRFLARQEPLAAPGMERFPAAILFADVSGFTTLADRLAQRGPAGAEALSDLLNAYFAELMALITGHGGEVITFAGDGLLAVWAATDGDEGLATATCDAGRCALAVQSALDGYQALDGLRLSLRIGVGAGEVMALRVGGVGGRWQLLLSGAPLLQVSHAEQRAAPGQAVLSPQAWKLVRDACTGRIRDGNYLRLTTCDAPRALPALPRPTQDLGDAVYAYVPEVVRVRLAAGQAEWLAELRRITALFLNLLDADPAAAEQLEPLQRVMATVQPILQRYEGSLKQVVVDDKGLTLIAVFGLSPWPTRTTRPGRPGPRLRCRRP